MPTIFLLLLMLLGPLVASGAVLTVPGQYSGIQAAMDASAPGDTVHVAPGTWYGLYTSPTHSLTLCSDYLFSQDSTDINETILDGEYAGTILDLVCENEWFVLCGFTMTRGQGQQVDIYAFCDRAGALQINSLVNAEIRDIVFIRNRAPRRASVIHRGTICLGIPQRGDLILRNIACYENVVATIGPNSAQTIVILPEESILIVDGLYYDGGGGAEIPFYAYANSMDSVYFNDIHVTNSLASGAGFLGNVTHESGYVFENLSSDDSAGPNSCMIWLNMSRTGVESSTVVVRNVHMAGLIGERAFQIYADDLNLDMDGLTVENCRLNPETAGVVLRARGPSSLRNAHFHNNTSGDSVSLGAKSLLYTDNIDIDGAHFHDNLAIVPADPDIRTTGGHSVYGAMVQCHGSNVSLRNMTFVNNRVEDLDVYNNQPMVTPYIANTGREIHAIGNSTLDVRNILVRNSRQPNNTPEMHSHWGSSMPGSTLTFGSRSLRVDSLRIEGADDGGLSIGADSLWLENVSLRDVQRSGFSVGQVWSSPVDRWYRFRNVHLDNIDVHDNFMDPEDLYLSSQVLLWVHGAAGGQVLPVVDFANVTVTGCDSMRHMFSFGYPVDFNIRNCLFWSNTYEQLVEWAYPISQTWEYNLLQEEVVGIGNQWGLDPMFRVEMGPPWLSLVSPAIDSGDPDPIFNDRDDPDSPGSALWPSVGILRNDIGYTGGPYAGTLDHLVAVRSPNTERPIALPQGFTLHPAFPNPFNPTTTLSYTLDHPMQIELSVYNLLGQQVRTLAFGHQDAGEHSVPFTAGEMASGVYVVELKAGRHSQTQKVLLLK